MRSIGRFVSDAAVAMAIDIEKTTSFGERWVSELLLWMTCGADFSK